MLLLEDSQAVIPWKKGKIGQDIVPSHSQRLFLSG